MLIERDISEKVLEAASEYPVVAIIGPRQSGKTTLAQLAFPTHRYISLEDYDIRAIAHEDPRRFLSDYPTKTGIILDEIQHAPQLLSYMQTIVDREKKKGYFIITGSQNFLMDEAITQTLAGRMAVLTLLPLSIHELERATLLPEKVETLIYKGAYPRAHAEKIAIDRLYKNYIMLYIERDVRMIKNVANLTTFGRFMRLCANHIGREVNLSTLGGECGIDHNTAKAWMSVLEASYVIVLLQPYYKNFGKRLIKSPKLYFIDTGIACNLLKIRSAQELTDHYLRGELFESLMISDLLKQHYNLEQEPSLYFWRDQGQHEIDCIVDTSPYQIPVEIKASKTVSKSFFEQLGYWKDLTEQSAAPQYVLYGGSEDHSWNEVKVLSWRSAGKLIQIIS
jgi:predicted AAA+ superfamily ATPase